MTIPNLSIGWVIALLVFLIALIFAALGHLPLIIGVLIAGNALARLL